MSQVKAARPYAPPTIEKEVKKQTNGWPGNGLGGASATLTAIAGWPVADHCPACWARCCRWPPCFRSVETRQWAIASSCCTRFTGSFAFGGFVRPAQLLVAIWHSRQDQGRCYRAHFMVYSFAFHPNGRQLCQMADRRYPRPRLWHRHVWGECGEDTGVVLGGDQPAFAVNQNLMHHRPLMRCIRFVGSVSGIRPAPANRGGLLRFRSEILNRMKANILTVRRVLEACGVFTRFPAGTSGSLSFYLLPGQSSRRLLFGGNYGASVTAAA